jgi:hypothetical protein
VGDQDDAVAEWEDADRPLDFLIGKFFIVLTALKACDQA